MKKLLKAVALATVMCMLLSTAAFASELTTGDKVEDTISVEVITAQPNEQVVLLIVNGDVESLAAVKDEQIQFIDQKEANASGEVDFGTVAVKTKDSVVDVYVGHATSNGPQKLGDDIDLKEVTGITIAAGTTTTIADGYSEGGKMEGYAAALTVTIPDDLTVTRMIWSFQLEGEELRRYSTAQAVDGATSGNVQFAAAFTLGATGAHKVTDVSAIFFTGNPDSEEDKANPANTHYLNAADKEQKENQISGGNE